MGHVRLVPSVVHPTAVTSFWPHVDREMCSKDGTDTGHSFPADSHWSHEQEGTFPAGVCDCPFCGGIRGVLLCSLCLSSKFFSRQLLSEATSSVLIERDSFSPSRAEAEKEQTLGAHLFPRSSSRNLLFKDAVECSASPTSAAMHGASAPALLTASRASPLSTNAVNWQQSHCHLLLIPGGRGSAQTSQRSPCPQPDPGTEAVAHGNAALTAIPSICSSIFPSTTVSNIPNRVLKFRWRKATEADGLVNSRELAAPQRAVQSKRGAECRKTTAQPMDCSSHREKRPMKDGSRLLSPVSKSQRVPMGVWS
ncbi:uncharacterized protein [Excalfactoria chinensis]|uniref:uncharacterized protein n=1 Tax=Excalfactoria chinensis TaxID=46218 RepID=UPI003B3BB8F2